MPSLPSRPRTRQAVPAVADAALTSLVVVVAANHWWVDGLVASALLGVALLLHPK